MESNSPNYAKWIPEAGGYVNNGTVVSKTPVYDANGLTQESIDMSQLTPQSAGTQENKTGSNVDINSLATKAGSLASLNLNTANTEYGPINTPATQSVIAGDTTLSPLEQVDKDYQYMVATNNLKGQIDALTKRSQMTGEDWSQMINNLHQQRNKKILDQDNAYGQAITEAYINGDYERVQQLQQEQSDWRANVGFGEMQKVEYQMQKDNVQEQYEYAYLTGLNDIGNSLSSMFGGLNDALMSGVNQLINFQYNPQTDMNLQLAQGYAVGAVKEQMNHTGMYYSSMTQSAITRAVAELVPVYEKMAKDEMKENIQMLMSVGNYLMNLEQTQFNLWKGQIEVQLALNQEKRNEYKDALERANAWGYVSNEDAVILGVAPGSPSPQALQEAREAQLALDKEQRDLYSKLVVADYENTLAIQRYYEEAEIKNKFDKESDYRDFYYKNILAQNQAIDNLNLENLKHQNALEEEWYKAYLKGDAGVNNSSPLLDGLDNDAIETYQKIMDGEATKSETITWFANNFVKDTDDKRAQSLLENTTTTNVLGGKHAGNHKLNKYNVVDQLNDSVALPYLEDSVFTQIDEIVQDKFTDNYDTTTKAFEEALNLADDYASIFSQSKVTNWEKYASKPYEHLIDKIIEANRFDYSKGNLYDDYDSLKRDAIKDIIKKVAEDDRFGDEVANIINEHYNDVFEANGKSRDNWTTQGLKFLGQTSQNVLNGSLSAYNQLQEDVIEPIYTKSIQALNKLNTQKNKLVADAVLNVSKTGIKLISPTV